jgi:hypothetical protein
MEYPNPYLELFYLRKYRLINILALIIFMRFIQLYFAYVFIVYTPIWTFTFYLMFSETSVNLYLTKILYNDWLTRRQIT